MEKKKYDLIFSLGGNCAAAHNLVYRNLRTVALPFDWTYIVDENALYHLANGFKNAFTDFMKYENLQELSDEEEKSVIHPDTYHYKDTLTGFYYVNHFHKDIRTTDEYKNIKETFDKRARRLLNLIEKSQSILMLLSTNFCISEKTITDFYNSFKEIYPDKDVEIILINFNCKNDEILDQNKIKIYRYIRDCNFYDMSQTNYEWAFLDDIKLNRKKSRDKLKISLFGYRVTISWNKKVRG